MTLSFDFHKIILFYTSDYDYDSVASETSLNDLLEDKCIDDIINVFVFVSLLYNTDRFHIVLYLFSISLNLLAFYHKCHALIGYATHYLFCDRQ